MKKWLFSFWKIPLNNDGNKCIWAYLFILFLDKNKALLKPFRRTFVNLPTPIHGR